MALGGCGRGMSVPRVIDYIHRPAAWGALTLLQFRANWERCRLADGSADARCVEHDHDAMQPPSHSTAMERMSDIEEVD